ncbi:testis-specific expressed protein 55 [Lepus europaeus]|uniref:testis-specific expressed protein 55 n=1 Tax=Lepus europaeus TaxID=9983 RepID=UPI002B492CE2|nr:testis-specific expressed protein 55 [Lepus europaeus]
MDESPEPALVEPLGHGNTTTPPTVDPTDDQEEDDETNQVNGEAEYPTDHREYDLVDQRSSEQIYEEKVPNQTESEEYGQIEHQVSGLTDRRTPQQMERKLSRQAERRTSEQTDRRTSLSSDRRMSTASDRRVSVSSDRRMSTSSDRRMSTPSDRRMSVPSDRRMSVPSDRRASEQADRRLSSQAERRVSEQTDRRVSVPSDRRMSSPSDRRMSVPSDRRASEQADRRLSSQAERRTSEQADRRLSSQAERRTSEQVDHRLSSLAERRASEQADTSLFISSDQRASEQIDSRSSDQAESRTLEDSEHRFSGLADQRTPEQTDQILFNLFESTSEHTDQGLSDQVDRKTSVKTQLAEQQAVDQAENSTDLTVDKADFSEPDQVDDLVDKQADDLSSNGSFDQYDRVFSQFRDSKEDKEAEYRIEPCKFEDSQIHLNSNSSVAMETETESPTTVSAHHLLDTRFTSNFVAKDPDFYQKFPSISSKCDNTSQENTQAIEINPDDFSEFEQERSYMEKQTHKRKFPPITYEDPYEVSLQYMEKHHILQIFQKITENLVYEKPEDPLHFMLRQVWNGIKEQSFYSQHCGLLQELLPSLPVGGGSVSRLPGPVERRVVPYKARESSILARYEGFVGALRPASAGIRENVAWLGAHVWPRPVRTVWENLQRAPRLTEENTVSRGPGELCGPGGT